MWNPAATIYIYVIMIFGIRTAINFIEKKILTTYFLIVMGKLYK